MTTLKPLCAKILMPGKPYPEQLAAKSVVRKVAADVDD
jgi:hypothetical protein